MLRFPLGIREGMGHSTLSGGTVRDGAASEQLALAMPSQVRRRLLFAAGGVLSSVYTLTSGATTAVASNLRCWSNSESAAPQRFTTSNDAWLRAHVYKGKYDGDDAYCVSSPQSACIDPLHPSHGRDGSVWIANGNRMTAGWGDKITGVGSTPSRYGLVYVNQQGTVTTLDPNGNTNLRPVCYSCWASILGGGISKLG